MVGGPRLIRSSARSVIGALRRGHYSCAQQAWPLDRIALRRDSLSLHQAGHAPNPRFPISTLIALAAILIVKTSVGHIPFP